MGGSSTQQTQQSSNSYTNLPDWVTQAGGRTYDAALGVAKQGYDPARDATVAAQNALTKGGQAALTGSVGQAQPLIQQGANLYGASGAYTPQTAGTSAVTAGMLGNTDLSKYMSPYTQQVIDATNAASRNALDQQLVSSDAAATAAHAFGGTRAANSDAVLRAQEAIGEGQTAAALNAQNYQQAVGQASTDISNQLDASKTNASNTLSASLANQSAAAQAAAIKQSAAQGLLSAGGALQSANLGDASALLQAGQGQQAYDQSIKDTATANADKRYQNQIQGINLRSSTLGLTPYNTSTSSNGYSNTDTSSSPDFATALLGGFKLLGGGTTGGLLGSGYLSDDRMKVDKVKLAKIPGTSMSVHAFRYKGDPKSYPKSVGLMASEVEKDVPGAIQHVGDHKIVDYGKVNDSLAHLQPRRPREHKVGLFRPKKHRFSLAG